MLIPEWLEPWGPIEDSEVARALEAELAREMSPGHPLYQVPVVAVGTRSDTDDVLFQLRDGSARVAVVHLTWRRAADTPPWPVVSFFESEGVWAATGMWQDHQGSRNA